MLEHDNIIYLVVHCSATPDHEPATVRDIHAMHQGFGWHGVGYHRVICRDGQVQAGRPDCWVGAHVYGYNDVSLGVCLIGCNSFTAAQFGSLATVLKQWQAEYPSAIICGHRDFAYTEKTCPNFDVVSWCLDQGIDPGVTRPSMHEALTTARQHPTTLAVAGDDGGDCNRAGQAAAGQGGATQSPRRQS